jgi:hypothetical protein
MPTPFNRSFPIAGDLALSADGTQLLLVSGADMALQQIKSAAEIWQGSVYWDPDAGLPMLSDILVKGPDLRVVQGIFRDWLLGVAGVVAVLDLNVELNRAARHLTVRFRVQAEDGTDAASQIAFAFA